MNISQKIVPLAAILTLLLTVGSSRATFEIALQEAGVNSGAITVVASGSDFDAVSFTGTYGDFSIKVLGGSSDNGVTLSDLLSSTTSVTNLSGTTQTLQIYVTQTDYSLPAGSPLNVESGLGGSVNNGTLSLASIFNAFADPNNNPLGTSGAGVYSTNQTALPTGSTFDTGSATGTFIRSGNYSLTSEVNLTLSGGAKINYSDHINVTPTPAPAGIVLALTGLPLLGLGLLIRRRKVA